MNATHFCVTARKTFIPTIIRLLKNQIRKFNVRHTLYLFIPSNKAQYIFNGCSRKPLKEGVVIKDFNVQAFCHVSIPLKIGGNFYKVGVRGFKDLTLSPKDSSWRLGQNGIL